MAVYEYRNGVLHTSDGDVLTDTPEWYVPATVFVPVDSKNAVPALMPRF